MHCDPERLQALQRIFDTVWMEVQAEISTQEPTVMRDNIARLVMDHADSDMSDDDIVIAVLDSIEFQSRRFRRRMAVG